MLMRKFFFLIKSLKFLNWNREKIKKFQYKKLKEILWHAYKYTRFYRKIFKEKKVSPDDLKSIDDLYKFPIIDREQVIKNYSEIITQFFKKNIFDEKLNYSSLTSGTMSGHSFRILFNEKAKDYKDAVFLRSLLLLGYKPWDKMVYGWNVPFEEKFYNKLGLLKKFFILYSLPLNHQIKLIKEINPEVIFYFTTVLYLLAKTYKKFSLNNLKFIITSGEILSKKMRMIIENAFSVPVYDFYGTEEFGIVAWECKERCGYHVNDDLVILEIIKDGEVVTSNESGEIVITSLWNTTFPLIRYKIGDIGQFSENECSCKSGFTLLKDIHGRKNEILFHKNKMIVPKKIIDTLECEEIKYFNLRKKGDNFFIEINVNNNNIDFTSLKRKIALKLSNILGVKTSKIIVKKRKEIVIPPSLRGKLQLINFKESTNDLISFHPFDLPDIPLHYEKFMKNFYKKYKIKKGIILK